MNEGEETIFLCLSCGFRVSILRVGKGVNPSLFPPKKIFVKPGFLEGIPSLRTFPGIFAIQFGWLYRVYYLSSAILQFLEECGNCVYFCHKVDEESF